MQVPGIPWLMESKLAASDQTRRQSAFSSSGNGSSSVIPRWPVARVERREYSLARSSPLHVDEAPLNAAGAASMLSSGRIVGRQAALSTTRRLISGSLASLVTNSLRSQPVSFSTTRSRSSPSFFQILEKLTRLLAFFLLTLFEVLLFRIFDRGRDRFFAFFAFAMRGLLFFKP